MLSLGKLTLPTQLLLAPMARVSDGAFRIVTRRCGGVGLACTELLSARGILENAPKSLEMATVEPEDRPLCIQLFGAHPYEMAEAARRIQDYGADVVDINMGCPVHKVVRRGAGAALLHQPSRAARLLEAIREAVRIPVTAKFRLGWDDNRIVAPTLAANLASAGASALIIHGRTVDQRFAGPVQLDPIARVVDCSHGIPVIGNGDIRSPQDAATMIARTGAAGVMIGRAAKRNPWIFRDTHSFLITGKISDPPSRTERIQLVRGHFEALRRLRGESLACALFRQRISWYLGKLQVPASLRTEIRAFADSRTFHRQMDRLEHREDLPNM